MPGETQEKGRAQKAGRSRTANKTVFFFIIIVSIFPYHFNI